MFTNKIYVELKNKSNTLNSSSTSATYQKMQKKLEEEPDAVCFLVIVVSNKSKNKEWKQKGTSNLRIREVTIDQFYEMLTDDPNAFKNMVKHIKNSVDKIIKNKSDQPVIKHTVYSEILEKAKCLKIYQTDKDQAIFNTLCNLALFSNKKEE